MKLRNLIGYRSERNSRCRTCRRKNRRRRRRGSGGSSGRPIGANSDPRGGSDSYPPCLASPSSFDSFNFFILYIHTIEPCLLLWFENQIHVFAFGLSEVQFQYENPNLPFCLTTKHNPLSEKENAFGPPIVSGHVSNSLKNEWHLPQRIKSPKPTQKNASPIRISALRWNKGWYGRFGTKWQDWLE